MNPYELIMKIDRKMKQDPNFANRFNKLVAEFNRTPGLQQEVMRIAQIQDEKKRKKALENLPDKASFWSSHHPWYTLLHK